MVRGFMFRQFRTLAVAAVLPLAALTARAQEEPAAAPPEPETAQAFAGPALLAVVALSEQRISLYDAEGRALTARVSSGQTEYETPVGVYSVLQKKKEHTSNLYDDASMPFMQRLTWSGIALHAGALPGYPASHGCVRMPYRFSEQIFAETRIGMRVVVARDDVAPAAISHPLLFQPATASDDTAGDSAPAATPIAFEDDEAAAPAASAFEPDVTAWPGRAAQLAALRSVAVSRTTEAEAAAQRANELKAAQKAKAAARAKTAKDLKRAERAKARADQRLERARRWLAEAKSESARKSASDGVPKAETAAAEAGTAVAAAQAADQSAAAELETATQALAAAEAAKADADAKAREARRKTFPVSVFVSLKTQRLYVRQGHEAVFDAPVTIAEPEKPIGTHVFTALAYGPDGNSARWSVISIGNALKSADRPAESKSTRRSRRDRDAAPKSADTSLAAAALDRISFAPDVAARVSEYVWPGSSLIVSDEEASKETGEATDFVVLISDEPQGGIKMRPRQPPAYERYYDEDDYEDYYEDRRRRRPRFLPFFGLW